MKKYIVGGFVRDRLMGIKPKDKDYVLVGSTEKDIEYLFSIGFTQVGKDFPVFLSPQGDEYALARVERKTGVGYGGFTVETSGVSLSDDLSRRDLTINAIAYDPVKKMHVDPYKGIEDVNNKVLRHVSSAFGEDPLRVLRLARFKARYQDFTVHPDTDKLVRQMVKSGELDSLTPERVYTEFKKAFADGKPSIFIKYLQDIGALSKLLPKFKPTKEVLNFMDKFSEDTASEECDMYIWTLILENENVSTKQCQYGQVLVPKEYIKFALFMKLYTDDFMKFHRKTPREMAEVFSSMNIKNHGSEKFLYIVNDFLSITKQYDSVIQDLVLKVYDRYIGTDLTELPDLIKSGKLTAEKIKEYTINKRLAEIEKMF